MRNKVVWFEAPTSDVPKAKKFFETMFDWKIELCGEGGTMAHSTAVNKDQNPIEPGGMSGGFSTRKAKDGYPPVVVQTESIDKTLKVIESGGGKIVTPRHSIGEWGFTAYFKDPEGNVIALWEKSEKK